MNPRFVPGRDLCNQILTQRPNPTVMATIEPVDLPAAALDDYAEYRRQGGRFDLDTWWRRYKDDYRAGPS